MKLAEQWSGILERLPRDWEAARLTLTVADEATAERAAVILGPAAPGRAGRSFRVVIDRAGRAGSGASPTLARRVFARLDAEGLDGELDLAGAESPEAGVASEDGAPAPVSSTGLAAQWTALLETLPSDWSHLYAEVELDSSDYVERGALLLAPANPLLAGARALRFRAARSVGYGVASGMARRCFERLDADGMTGRVRVLKLVSDARPVYTQGPVWYAERGAV